MTAFHLLIGIILAACAAWLIYNLYRATRLMRRGHDERQSPDDAAADNNPRNQAVANTNTD